jgi:hypothetical protein
LAFLTDVFKKSSGIAGSARMLTTKQFLREFEAGPFTLLNEAAEHKLVH